MDFEETEEKLTVNVASLGFDLRELSKRKKLVVDYVSIDRSQSLKPGIQPRWPVYPFGSGCESDQGEARCPR